MTIEEYGPEIKIDGRKPDWLHGYEGSLGYQCDNGIWYGPDSWWSEKDIIGNKGGWPSVIAIRLPASHSYYAPKPAQEPVQGRTDQPVYDRAVVERMVSLVAKIAKGDWVSGYASDTEREARAIQALREPDTDLVEARRIAAEVSDFDKEKTLAGELDNRGYVKCARLAIRAGRNLERQAIEKERGL